MKLNIAKIVIAGVAALVFASAFAEACTVTLVTKGASDNGSVLVSHSNDGFGSDPNVVFVPAKNHPQGSKRPIYPSSAAIGDMPDYNCFSVPQLVAPERSPGYDYPGKQHTKPLGYIPEVQHTYAYLDAEYPIMNEHGLMLGECTDLSDRLKEAPFQEGKGIFYSSELGRVALERCQTAREAIQLMGKLIDEYGLWGTAESLIVADKNEGWIMEMQPTPNGRGGFWIAEKIPDGDIFVAANQLRIRAVRKNDPCQIYNPLLPQMLQEAGWATYDEQGNLDWVKSLQGKEYNHPYYSLRRVWRAMSTVAPSKNFSAQVDNWDTKEYPLSVTPDKKLAVSDVMTLYRDFYKGTELDKSGSPLSGLFASPYHYEKEKGERSILTAKSSFSYIAQVNDKLPMPIMWLSINTAAENPYVPFAVAEMPKSYNHSLRDVYDPSKMYWASSQVMALTQGYFSVMYPIVGEAVQNSETMSMKLVNESLGFSREAFADALRQNAIDTVKDWQSLYVRLLMKYDGGAGVIYDKTHFPDPRTLEEYR